MAKDMISELLGLDDAGLREKMGLDVQEENFRAQLDRADKLTGEPRAKVIRELNRMFTPQSYAIQDIGYTIDNAEAKAKGKTTPSDITACCCGDD